MNERIKLPAQEWLGYDPERGDIHGYTFEQMREFAELIVRECLAQADALRDALESDGEDQQALGADWVGLAIARHFGVE